MILALNIQTETPEELLDVLRRLGVGGAPVVTAESPNPPAAAKTRAAKPEPTVASVASTSPAPTTPAAAPATSAPSPTAPATVAAETSVDAAPVTEADLIAAANAAAATGVNPGKIQAYIRENYTKADGTPGTLKGTAPDQQSRLLADLQKIARKELAL